MSQVLVSVKFQGYYLELLISRESTIKDLVLAMRQNTFIHANIPDERLRYKTTQGEELQLNNKVSDIVQNQQNTQHYLEVEVLQEVQSSNSSQISQSSISTAESEVRRGPDFFQAQTNRILERIVRYLKDGSIESLLRAKQNRRIQSTMAEHLTSIGQSFDKIQRCGQFYLKCFQKIANSKASHQIKTQIQRLISKYSDYIGSESRINLVREMVRVKIEYLSMENEKQQKQFSVHLTNQLLSKQKQESQRLKNQNNTLKTFSQEFKLTIVHLKSKLEQRDNEIKELNNKYQQVNQNLKSKLQTITSLKQSIQDQKAQLQKEKQQNDKLIQIKIKQIQDQSKQIQKLKEDSFGLQKIKQFANLQNVDSSLLRSQIQGQLPGDFNHIIRNENHTSQLKKIIKNQMRKQISSVVELLSFDWRQNRNYSLKKKFHQYLSNKTSLLVIIRTNNNKIFGAFTEQKLTLQPESYYFPEFFGNSFLFSLIKGQMKNFNVIEGQNSLLFDFNYLIFGNEDLMINFEEHKCSSKFSQGKGAVCFDLTVSNQPEDPEQYKFLVSDEGKNLTFIEELKVYEVKFKSK